MFITHSLGGLIAKEVRQFIYDTILEMLTSHWTVNISRNDKKYSTCVYESTRAFAFFATPHHGSIYAKWGRDAARIVNILQQNPENELIRELKLDSSAVQKIEEHFRQSHDRWHFLSFYETKPQTGNDLVSYFVISLSRYLVTRS